MNFFFTGISVYKMNTKNTIPWLNVVVAIFGFNICQHLQVTGYPKLAIFRYCRTTPTLNFLPTNKSSCLQGTGHWRCPGVGRSSSGLYGGDKAFQDLVETPGGSPSENGFEECCLWTGGTAWMFTLPLLKIWWCGKIVISHSDNEAELLQLSFSFWHCPCQLFFLTMWPCTNCLGQLTASFWCLTSSIRRLPPFRIWGFAPHLMTFIFYCTDNGISLNSDKLNVKLYVVKYIYLQNDASVYSQYNMR